MFALRRITRLPGLGFLSPMRLLRRLAMLLVIGYVAATFAGVWLASKRDAGDRPAQAIIVLGAAQYNGRPSPALKGRLDHALALYEQGMAPLIVVTGGRQSGDRTTEASAGATYLIAHGVPDGRIEREVQGTDTYLSLAATARFLKKRDVRDVILVSDSYHSARVQAIAEEVGFQARTSPVPGTARLNRLARETAAMAVGRIVSFRRLSAWTDG